MPILQYCVKARYPDLVIPSEEELSCLIKCTVKVCQGDLLDLRSVCPKITKQRIGQSNELALYEKLDYAV